MTWWLTLCLSDSDSHCLRPAVLILLCSSLHALTGSKIQRFTSSLSTQFSQCLSQYWYPPHNKTLQAIRQILNPRNRNSVIQSRTFWHFSLFNIDDWVHFRDSRTASLQYPTPDYQHSTSAANPSTDRQELWHKQTNSKFRFSNNSPCEFCIIAHWRFSIKFSITKKDINAIQFFPQVEVTFL